jgi:hypothetical protein
MAQTLGKAIPGNKIVREIMAEWNAFVDEHAYRDEEGELIWGDALIRHLGETGLATLRYLARRGHFESSRALKETFLGLPEQPLSVRVREKSAHETEDMIRVFLIETMRMQPATADAMLDRFKRAALEEGALTDPDLPALPEHKTARRRGAR